MIHFGGYRTHKMQQYEGTMLKPSESWQVEEFRFVVAANASWVTVQTLRAAAILFEIEILLKVDDWRRGDKIQPVIRQITGVIENHYCKLAESLRGKVVKKDGGKVPNADLLEVSLPSDAAAPTATKNQGFSWRLLLNSSAGALRGLLWNSARNRLDNSFKMRPKELVYRRAFFGRQRLSIRQNHLRQSEPIQRVAMTGFH